MKGGASRAPQALIAQPREYQVNFQFTEVNTYPLANHSPTSSPSPSCAPAPGVRPQALHRPQGCVLQIPTQARGSSAPNAHPLGVH